MPFLDAIVPFADILLDVPEGEYLSGLPNKFIHIRARSDDDIYIRAQPPGLIQQNQKRCSAFEDERHFDTAQRLEQAKGKYSPLQNGRIRPSLFS